MTEKMKPCPFCGLEVDLEDGDTLILTVLGGENAQKDLGHIILLGKFLPNSGAGVCIALLLLADAEPRSVVTLNKSVLTNGINEYKCEYEKMLSISRSAWFGQEYLG